MTNQGDIIKEFLVRTNQSTTTAFYTDAMLTNWCSMANQFAAAQFKWPFTEGRYSTTTASTTINEDGYTALQYPEGFRTDSIRLMTVGGKRFNKREFYKFQSFLQDNTGDTSVLYTDFNRTIYINPNAASFSGTIALWGQINVAPLNTDTVNGVSGSVGQDPTAPTIFSGIEEDGNEAIIQEMLSYGLTREKAPTAFYRGHYISAASFHHQVAMDGLKQIWTRITEEQAMYQDVLDDGMFKRFDVTRGGFKEDIFRRDQWGF